MFKKFTYLFIASILAISSCSDYSNNPNESISLVPVKIKGDDGYSFLNVKTGKIVFQEEFEREPSAVNDGVYYTRNKDGNYEYHRIESVDSEEPEKSVVDIPGEFITAGLFSNGMAIVVEEGGAIKAIDDEGETVFELSGSEHEGIVKVSDKCVNNRIKFSDADGRIGFLNEKGKVVIKAQFSAVQNFKNGLARAYRRKADGSNEYLIIDEDGEVQTTIAEGIQIGEKIGGNYLARISEDRFGIVDEDNEVLEKFDKKIEDVAVLGQNILYQRNGKYGLMNSKGEVLIRHRYDNLSKIDADGELLIAIKKDEHIILNSEGEEIFKDDGDEARGLGNGNYLVKDGKNINLRDKEGKELADDDIRRINKSSIELLTDRWESTPSVKSDYYNSAAILDLFKSISSKGNLNNFSIGQNIVNVYPTYLKVSQENTGKSENKETASEVSDDNYVYESGQSSYATYWGFSFSDSENTEEKSDDASEATTEEAEYAADADAADDDAKSKPAFEFKDVAEDISLWASSLDYEINLNTNTQLNVTLNFNDRLKKRDYKQVMVESPYGSYPKQEHVANIWNKEANIRQISGRISIDSRNNKSEDIIKEIAKSLVDSKWEKKSKTFFKKGDLSLTLKEQYSNNISFVIK